jgi:SAM-dependent methyltransferase
MWNRREAILTTAAAAAIAVTGKQLEAKTADPDADIKFAAWDQTPEELARWKLRFPKLDNESIQDFTRGMSKFIGGSYAHGDETAHTERFLRSKGFSMVDDTSMSYEQCFNLMMQDPVFATKLRLARSMFHMHWDNPRRVFHGEQSKYLAEMALTDKSGPGTLELNPDMVLPDHVCHEIHTMPGGYVGDPFAGWVYDYGHIAGTDALRDHGRYLHFAQSQPKPADGKVRRILDLGCGIGYSTTALKLRFPNAEVWGIDAGGPMVRYAHYRAVKNGIAVNFAQRLAADTKFPDNYFDLVTDSIMFHETSAESTRRIVAEAHRVLRPGGVFGHYDVGTAGNPKISPATTIPGRAQVWSGHRHNLEVWWIEYIETDFPGLLRDTGFVVDLTGPGSGNTRATENEFPGVVGIKPV